MTSTAVYSGPQIRTCKSVAHFFEEQSDGKNQRAKKHFHIVTGNHSGKIVFQVSSMLKWLSLKAITEKLFCI